MFYRHFEQQPHVHIIMCIHVSTCAHICIHVYMYVHVYIYVYTCLATCLGEYYHILHGYMCISVQLCLYVHTCVYTCIHMYTHVYIHTTNCASPHLLDLVVACQLSGINDGVPSDVGSDTCPKGGEPFLNPKNKKYSASECYCSTPESRITQKQLPKTPNL